MLQNTTEDKFRYPLLLVHGMGFRDRDHLNYWGRIPAVLESEGATVYYGNQDSNGSIESNAAFLAERIRKIAAEEHIEKFNVIADKLLKLPDFMVRSAAFMTDIWFKILGDRDPHTYDAVKCFRTSAAREFNLANPDDPDIYYQSYAFTCKKVTSDMFLWFSNLVVRMVEGENDGLLTPESVKWGDFRGQFSSVTNRGISHCDSIDMRRRPFSRKQGDGISDITDFYRNVAIELKQKGF